ncbi:MAG: hypothetical protein P1P86_06815 [Bacteroidales bacterium]|nr:hypothetical protein [Bacteroidales bacterium]
MKTVRFLMILMLLATFATTVSAQKKMDPAGTWAYEAPQAPYEYSSGDIVISKEAKDYTVKMVLGEFESEAGNVVYENNVLSFNIFVEMETVEIKLTVEKDSMEGTAAYSEGSIPITAKKK